MNIATSPNPLDSAHAGPTRVLIAQSQPELGAIWQAHLERAGMTVVSVQTQEAATDHIQANPVDVIILDLILDDGASFAVSDYAGYNQPDAQVVFVTDTSFFSDGSIFAHARNARAFLGSDTPPADLAAMIEHYGAEVRAA